MKAINGHPLNASVGHCPTCGTHRFLSRKAARRAARALYPGTHQRAYACGGFWHYGQLSKLLIRRGRTGREIT